jgi:hypothetical protein
VTAGLLAFLTAALFSGAAVYISLAEHPARLGLDDRSLLAQWKPAYKRGFAMQGSLVITGFSLALVAWWQTGIASWLIGALVLLVNWPFTLFVMMPTNHRLMATPLNDAGAESRALLVRWGKFHAVRGALGTVATCLFLWGAIASVTGRPSG